MSYKQHPLSSAFPAMGDDERQALRESIENIGVQNPITLFEGMVIDGWHRYSVAAELGMHCPVVELADGVDPRHFVLAQNKARRHITTAQMVLATTAVYSWYPADGSAQRGGVAGPDTPPKTNAELAEIAGSGTRSIRQGKAIQSNAVPEVQEAVKRGEIGLEKAAAIAKLPKEQQAEAIHKPTPKAEEPESYEPDADELAANEAAQRADIEAMNRLLEADDKLAHAHAEVKRLNAELASLRISRDGYMNQCNELIVRIKSLQRQIDKMQKVSA
jgi:hypothetical protein